MTTLQKARWIAQHIDKTELINCEETAEVVLYSDKGYDEISLGIRKDNYGKPHFSLMINVDGYCNYGLGPWYPDMDYNGAKGIEEILPRAIERTLMDATRSQFDEKLIDDIYARMNNEETDEETGENVTIQIDEEIIPMVRAMFKKELEAAKELVNDEEFGTKFPALAREAKRGAEWMESVLVKLGK